MGDFPFFYVYLLIYMPVVGIVLGAHLRCGPDASESDQPGDGQAERAGPGRETALLFALELSKQFSINLQLLGGRWILQVLPTLVGGLYTRWFHRWALLLGWAAGMIYGTIAAYNVSAPGNSHFGGSTDHLWGMTVYFGLTAVILNLLIAVVLTPVLRALGVPEGGDETRREQYTYDPQSAPPPVLVASASSSAVCD